MATRKLLVEGATGKQGGSLIAALSGITPPSFKILALTRDASSPSAKFLASKSNITIIEGSSSSPASIFAAHSDIYGVFSMTMPRTKISEEDQARPLIDESIKHGVSHFVFTSVDRGGDVASDTNPTEIHHFATKHRVEEHLKKRTLETGSKMQWTILRPVAFFDNLTPDFMGKGFASMWAGVGYKPLQPISTRDVGLFAAKAFMQPEEFLGRAVSIAGDELNFEQAKKVFKETLGYAMPETYGVVGWGIKRAVREMGMMFDWFREVGCKADVKEFNSLVPSLSQWKDIPPRSPNINLVKKIYTPGGLSLTNVHREITQRQWLKKDAPSAERNEPAVPERRRKPLGLIRKHASSPGPLQTDYFFKKLELGQDVPAEVVKNSGQKGTPPRQGHGHTNGAPVIRDGGGGLNTEPLGSRGAANVQPLQATSDWDGVMRVRKHVAKRAAFESTYWNPERAKERIDALQK
ncbi:NAD(P)-binding protein [Cadophora sp. DSE1049]|nr:NAD(P)-binding protein [Cadophora sp. DSE1049]